MFCKSCGSEVKTGEKFCRSCGAPIEGNNGAAAFGELADKISANKTSLGGVMIGKILILVALICFFFTFMSVSCSGVAESEATISGKDMIFGDSSVTNMVDKQYDSHSGLFNIFVCLSAVSGIAAIVIRKRKISAGLAGLSGVLLLIFRFTAKSYYKIGDMTLKEMEEQGMDYGFSTALFEIKFGFALYLAIVLFIAAAAIIMMTSSDENVSLPPPPINNTYTPPSSGNNNENTQ